MDSFEKDYLHQLTGRMFKLFEMGVLCDTTLVTSDKELSAHSIVLAAASHIFETALSNCSTDTSSYRLELIGLDSGSMKEILKLIYTGRSVWWLNF